MKSIAIQRTIKRYVNESSAIHQAKLAQRLRVDPSTVSRHLSGETNLTLEQCLDYLRAIGSPELLWDIWAEIAADIIGNAPRMNNIDDGFPAVVTKAVEEYEEAIEACRALQKKLCNVRNPENFEELPESVREQARERLAQSVADIFYVVQQMVCSVDKQFGIRPAEYFGLTVQKLIERRYVDYGHKKRAL